MTFNLAQEILDIIIDNLHDDKATLHACSLVSRAWVPSSQLHMFNSITIYMHRDSVAGTTEYSGFDAFSKALDVETSGIWRFVRRLVLKSSPEIHQDMGYCSVEFIHSLLDRLPRLHTLHLAQLKITEELPKEMSPRIHGLKELHLNRLIFATTTDLCLLLKVFPQLHSLTARTLIGMVSSPIIVPLKLQLKTLSLSSPIDSVGVLLSQLMGGGCIDQLTSFTCHMAVDLDPSLLSHVLRTIGPTLKYLELHPSSLGSFREVDFSPCSSIDELRLRIQRFVRLSPNGRSWDAAMHVLTDLSFTDHPIPIRKVSFCLEFDPCYYHEDILSSVSWPRLAGLFDRAAFSNLKEVAFEFHEKRWLHSWRQFIPNSGESKEATDFSSQFALLRDKLHTLHEKGILQMQRRVSSNLEE
ncbi:hypothetical protein C8Q75DRAFT_812043 [Abortiporus biennis]|nr:hypothetical protein C8Q75DRAFT_812043 [Abortiporus biennis]